MKKRVYIIHGWEGNPDSNWFPWLKQKLEEKNFSVEALTMPDTMHPTLDGWLTHLQETIKDVDAHTFLVGHSLGVIAILRFLEALQQNEKIGGAVLVAGFSEPIAYDELGSFFSKPLDYEKVKNSANAFVAIHSSNDPYVPLKNGEILRDKLGANLIVIENAGHLNAGGGFTELPTALKAICKIALRAK